MGCHVTKSFVSSHGENELALSGVSQSWMKMRNIDCMDIDWNYNKFIDIYIGEYLK